MANSKLEYKEIKRVKKPSDNGRRKVLYILVLGIIALLLLFAICHYVFVKRNSKEEAAAVVKVTSPSIDIGEIPAYSGEPYVVLNDNKPYLDVGDSECGAFEEYSELDSLGRCGTAYANLCTEHMPTEERGEIGMIKPSGWHTVKYPDVIEDRYLYNRCHLIAFSLAGENANERNLITGTRYFNVNGMLPFENEVRTYIVETGNHVLYRVTPIFEGKNLLASGVVMEAYSVEDRGKGICFNVFVYNVQPGIVIDYSDGSSCIKGEK